MTEQIIQQIATELQLRNRQVQATITLLEGGATVPFIARYRKEMTGTLNEVQITQIRDALQRLQELEKRKEAILKSIEEQGKLTPQLEMKIQRAETMTILEDIYLPYKPKRRTRATMAREKGLEPLAKGLMVQRSAHVEKIASQYIDTEKGVETVEDALAGARDIIAEWVNENANARSRLRYLFERWGTITSKLVKNKEEEGAKFKDYFDWNESVKNIPSHRFLAIQRGVKEGILRMSIEPDKERALEQLYRIFLRARNECADQVKLAVDDAYKRLLQPSLETEIRQQLKERSDAEAIRVFVTNLRELLLAPPLGQKNVMAIDPGYRTGCKIVCLNPQGELVHYTTIYPFDRSPIKRYEAAGAVEELCKQYKVEAIAIGNGTAGRETQQFIKKMNLPKGITLVMVNESGASIYSASEVARAEFPHHDVTVRGTVSIGRRLMDPLAELVKIDPKSIGVGQYQHDVGQTALKKSLDDVVESCVNAVGVEINTASKELLTYVSGLGKKTAQNVVNYRNQKGVFTSKKELKKVSGIGPKAFEQAAGFIRISGAKNPLDASAVHPESYAIVEKMAKDLNCSIQDLIGQEDLRKQIKIENYVTDTVGIPTLQDIMKELSKPGRDPREQFENVQFADHINEIDDLELGMILPGIITNVTNFGAFVDIGIKQAGLVHVSELTNQFIRDPKKVVKVNQRVKVKVLDIDAKRNRVSLSIKQAGGG